MAGTPDLKFALHRTTGNSEAALCWPLHCYLSIVTRLLFLSVAPVIFRQRPDALHINPVLANQLPQRAAVLVRGDGGARHVPLIRKQQVLYVAPFKLSYELSLGDAERIERLLRGAA